MQLITILGIQWRAGTNYLRDLLGLHPDCGIALPIAEDHLLTFADHLAVYTDKVREYWNEGWELERSAPGSKKCAATADFLLRSIGEGLERFLFAQVDGRRSPSSPVDAEIAWRLYKRDPKNLVTKTPSVQNLDLYFRLFPNAKLIILVRDGRDLVESGMRTFGWEFDRAARDWVKAARTIIAFEALHPPSSHPYMIVRYEDLVDALEPEVRRILGFLGLDAERYDFGAAARWPVRGSSTFGRTDEVEWGGVEKTPAFNPVGRWKAWDVERQRAFETIARDELARFGYLR